MTNFSSKIHICLIGNGRLANQLKLYLQQNSYAYSHVFRSQHSSEEMRIATQASTHVWLAIQDQAIEEVYSRLANSSDPEKVWVHFSGAYNSPHVNSAHPLMTFSKKPMTISEFSQVHFVITPTVHSSKNSVLSDLLPGFSNPWSRISAEKKAFYHTLCVVAGNFPVMLWSEALKQLQALEIPSEAFNGYLNRVLSNFIAEGDNALTGPLIRNDLKTIQSNLEALEGHALKPIYEAFVRSKGISL